MKTLSVDQLKKNLVAAHLWKENDMRNPMVDRHAAWDMMSAFRALMKVGNKNIKHSQQ
jgi:hypothetical protein